MAAETIRASMVDEDGTRAHTGPAAPPTSILDAGDAPPATPVADGPAGRYELLDEIDRGGMGVVVRAHDRTLGREVAVKVLQERFAAGSVIARRFVDEARIAGQLQHPGIPPVHDLGTLPDGRPFLAMKLIKGRTLDALLRDRPDPTARAGLRRQALEWLRADLAQRAEKATSVHPADREAAAGILSWWLDDGDLAGVRTGPGRIDLPADERSAWDAFWADVRAALERARQPPAAKPPVPKPATVPAPGD
jgi:hypothetical protein